MLKGSLFFILCLSALTGSILSQGPQYTYSSTETQFLFGPTNQIGPLLFVNDFEYLNTSNGAIGSLLGLGVNCSNTPVITISNQIWCLGTNTSQPNSYSMNNINTSTLALNFAVPFSVVFNGSVNPTVDIVQSGEYVLVKFENSGQVPSSSVYVFNTISHTFVCPFTAVEQAGLYQGAYFAGDYLVYQTQKGNENEISYLPCNGGAPVTTKVAKDTFSDQTIYSFNNSEVFLTVYIAETPNNQQIAVYALPFSASATGAFTVGTAFNLTGFTVVDADHFAAVISVNGFYVIGLYVITSDLKFLQVASYPTRIPSTHGTSIGITGLYNEDVIMASIFHTSDGIIQPTTFFFSFARGLGAPTGYLPPLRFANNTVVNINSFGFFSQISLGSPINFFYAPSNTWYQDPADPTHISTLYVPSSKSKVLDHCYFVDYWAQNSTVNIVNFTSCPIAALSQAPTIKDVQYDANGTPYVVYRDSLANLYIVNPKGAAGPFTLTTLLAYPAVSINVTSGIGSFMGVQLTSFVIGTFYINNGSVISKQSAPGDTYNYVYKLSGQYYLTASANSQATVFAVYNGYGGARVNQITTQFVLPFSYSNPISAVGVNPESSTVYGAIIAQVGPEFFLINSNGLSTMIENKYGPVNEVYPFGPEEFFTYGDTGTIRFLTTFTVTNYTQIIEI